MAPLDFKHFTSADYKPGEDDAVKYYAQKRKKQYHGNEGKEVKELSMKPDKKLPNLKVPVKGKKGISRFMRKKLIAKQKDDINAAVQSADRKPEKYVKPDGKVGIRMVKTDKEVIKKEQMQVFRVGHKDMSGNVHATDPDDAMRKLRKKGLKGDIKLTHRGSVKSMPKRRVPIRQQTESIDNHPKVKAARKAHAAGTWDGNVDKEGEAVVHINGKPHTVTNKFKAKNLRKETIVDPRDLRGRPKKDDPNPESKYGIKHPLHPANIAKKKKMKEAINHDDAHRDAQQHSDGSMSVKKIPSMIKKPGDKHLHLHMKSYHKEKDGQDFAKKHGYKVKNYVKTPSGTRMDIHKEMVDPMDLRGRPKKKDPNPESPYGMKHPLHPANIAKKKAKANVKQSNPDKYEPTFKEAKSFQYFDNKDDAHAHAKKHGGRVFVNTGKGATKVKGKPVNTHVVIKREEVEVDEALTMKQRMDKRRIMKRNKARIAIGRKRAKKKMANMKVIKKRSDRQARNEIAKKLMRGIPKRELSPARKRALEKRLESPALKQRIKRLSKRMFKDVRKKEVMRKKG